MFGIGLPEMILILALALIVVGPDKLPDLARSLAKGIMELKKTAEGLKKSFSEEGNPLDEIRPDLEEAAKSLKQNLLDIPPYQRNETIDAAGVNPPAENAAKAYQELIKKSGSSTPGSTPASLDSVAKSHHEDDKTAAVIPMKEDTEIEPPKQQDRE
jgi:sec-independent protein translocase protein TatB